MSKPILLKDGLVISLNPIKIEECDLLIHRGKIIEKDRDIKRSTEYDIHNLKDCIILPGMVCAHHHIYSALSRGMPPPPHTPKDFYEKLDWIWWMLDKSLDKDMIYLSCVSACLDAIRSGTTTIFDHHSSPSHINGSLDILKSVFKTFNMRGCFCYETSDRDGQDVKLSGINENIRMLECQENNYRANFGLHASFTVDDDTLENVIPTNGIHVHACEDKCDRAISISKYGKSPVKRFLDHGLLNDKSILVHCIHLTEEEQKIIRDKNCWMIHNCRSNMNNSVGYAPLSNFYERGCFGTDGIDADIFAEIKAAFFQAQYHQVDNVFTGIMKVLQNNFRLAEQYFGYSFGSLEIGNNADLIVLKYNPPTLINEDNFVGHLLFGISSTKIRSTMINGNWKYLNNKVVIDLNFHEIMNNSREKSKVLWNRINNLWNKKSLNLT